MLTRVDRVQVVVGNRSAAASAFQNLLDAAVVRADRVACLAARRTVLRLGSSEVELLEPDGAGVAGDFLSATRGGLFAAGVATRDRIALRRRLEARPMDFLEEGQQLFLSPDQLDIAGLRLVVSDDVEPEPIGLISHLYEVTLLARSHQASAATFASHFGLDSSHFAPIRSLEYGYEGVLTLFHPDRPDRLEIITPTDPVKTMGRFFGRRGPSLYMCYGESDHLEKIRERLLEHAPRDWTGPPQDMQPGNLFIHPKALGGMMLGVSRTSLVWMWSGRPERVTPGPHQ
jgi:hypothetical protein